jgi:K+-transporting ATPase ATPase C chain
MPNSNWRGSLKHPGTTTEQLRSVVAEHSQARTFGVLGEPRVNVLELNLDLDKHFPAGTRAKTD